MSDAAQFSSVSEMVRATSENDELVQDLDQRISERQLIKHLIAHRVKNGLSQQDMAKAFGCTQSRISKLENSKDEDLRLGDLEEYTAAIGLQPRLVLASQNQTLVDEIKYHAFRIRRLLNQLVELAENDEQIATGVSRFVCIETPLNLLKIVVETANRIPQQVLDRLPGLVIEDECVPCERETNEVPSELQAS